MSDSSRRLLLVVMAIAIVHAVAFMVYQRPDVEKLWTDQGGYRRLGHALATTGTFTRYPGVKPFEPETLRTPGYPALVAIAYRAFGERQEAVSGVQAVIFALICAMVFIVASRFMSERLALIAALATALYPPIPYYGALVMTDVFATLLMCISIWLVLRALDDRRISQFALAGALFGLTALTRPEFVLFPPALLLALFVMLRFDWRRLLPFGWTLGVFAVVLAPWLLYNVVYNGRLTMSPAGGIGRGTWEASWQGVWPGRVQADLTKIAENSVAAPEPDIATVDATLRDYAKAHDLPVEPMLTYVHQWRDIRRIWAIDAPPRERSIARVAADDEYLRVGLENIRREGVAHVVRRATTGTFVLWAAEIPIRYSDINATRPIVIRAIWLLQVALVGLALGGLGVLFWRGRVVEATTLGSLMLYITGVHLPILAEARYSLPAKPFVIALATLAVAEAITRFRKHASTSPRTAGS